MQKCIFQGKLDFGSPSSYEIAFRQFEHRAEVFFKNDVVFKVENVFDEASHSLSVPRQVVNITEKTWKNTIELLDYIKQFGLSGQVEAWMVESGKVLQYGLFEPKGDKTVITAFKTGRKLLNEEGREEEALEELSKAISKYDQHSQAYERRGYTNLILKIYDDAMYDFKKSIRLDATNGMAYYGKGCLNMQLEKWADAIEDFELAAKNLLAVQDRFWTVRRHKATCLIKEERWEEALKEYKFLVKKRFDESSKNYKYIPMFNTMYVKCLITLNQEKEALEFIEESLDTIPVKLEIHRRSMLTDRGLVRKALGQNDYQKDWEEAAALGESRASELLEDLVK
jgi:tetratricopeptide (TPR) repeat protein